ncbi:pectinesterase family protein, partial [Salmonella enterica subsp. enterica]
ANYMFQNCATQTTETIGTGCSATVWSQSNGLQLQNLTIGNALLDTVDAGDHSAVALRTDGDNVVIDNVRLIGRQNTFMVNTANIHNETDNKR